MLTGKSGVLYTGITNHLARRLAEHKQKRVSGFSQKYNLTKLVWFEVHGGPKSAIAKEKQIKSWSRPKKLELINAGNPGWVDLSLSLK
jgi:putative endonuclease